MRPLRPLRSVPFVLTVFGLYMPRAAHANGRFPKAQAVETVPGGPRDGRDDVVLRATFGVLLSNDGGKSFHWLCEQALGFSSTWDPPITVTRDRRLWVGLPDGMRVARLDDGGCEVVDVPALKGELVADLTTDPSGEHPLMVTSTPGKAAHVWRARAASRPHDDAFERLGPGVRGFTFDTIEVAPSKPSRVYLTATPEGAGPRAHVFRSDDGGATLVETKPALPLDGRLFVSAVDPTDPERVLARLLHGGGSDVLLSTDGAKTFRSVLHMDGAMFGFTRAGDGSAYYAGSGDPKDGVWRSRDRGATWEPAAKVSVFCLHAAGAARLFACSNPYTPGGFALAASTDGAATFAPLATFDAVVGPVVCDAGRGAQCAAPWPETASAIATRAHLQEPTIAPLPPAASSSDANADAGAPPAAPHPSSRCGCRAVGTRSNDRGAAMALLVALASLARRWTKRLDPA